MFPYGITFKPPTTELNGIARFYCTVPFKSLCRQAGLPPRQKNKILPAEFYHIKVFHQVCFQQLKGLFTNFFSPVRAHLFDAARWIKLRPNRWILSATSKRLYRGVDRTGKGGSFTRESLIDIINPFSIYAPF
jgi:hypothetical protein